MKTRPEITGRKSSNDLDAYSIAEFCQRHGLSVASFYKFKKQMPKTFRIGTRVLISKESAERWRRARELATA